MILIELDRPRHLRFTINAVVDAEKLEGVSLRNILQQGGFKATRTMLWAGLRWEDRTFTLEKAGDLIEVWLESHPYSELEQKIAEALQEQGWYKRIREESQGQGEPKGEPAPDT